MVDQSHAGSPWPEDLSALCFEMPFADDSILFESGKGVRLFDAAGRSYLDAMSGVFVSCFGYDCQPIVDAMTAQLRKLQFNPPLHGTNRNALALAEALVDFAPAQIKSAKLVSGGSEAIEAAIRLARLYHFIKGAPTKLKIVSHHVSYHGPTFGALSVSGHPGMNVFGPGMPGTVHSWTPSTLESDLDIPESEAADLAVRLLDRTIEQEGPDSVAALIVEPLSYLHAMVPPPPGYLARLREICDKHNILLIFDEIVTGFGRTGQPFAADTFGVVPDLMCVGKGLSGGYSPLAALLITEHISDLLQGHQGSRAFAPTHTYAANPLASAAGLAAITYFREGGFLERIQSLADTLHPRIRELVGDRGKVHTTGLLIGARFPDPEGRGVGALVAQSCLRRGVIIRGDDDYLALAPAYVTTEADAEELCLVLGDALDEVFGAAS
jgi:beta-alanine--pyruvate transaminase